LHWAEEEAIKVNRAILKQHGYLPAMQFNKVVTLALGLRALTREQIYVTQVFHLVPRTRSQRIEPQSLDLSFSQVTVHELQGRKVLALGSEATRYCRKYSVPHEPVCHPSSRGHSHAAKADLIAAGLERLGF
jgi:hypothetical protein